MKLRNISTGRSSKKASFWSDKDVDWAWAGTGDDLLSSQVLASSQGKCIDSSNDSCETAWHRSDCTWSKAAFKGLIISVRGLQRGLAELALEVLFGQGGLRPSIGV